MIGRESCFALRVHCGLARRGLVYLALHPPKCITPPAQHILSFINYACVYFKLSQLNKHKAQPGLKEPVQVKRKKYLCVLPLRHVFALFKIVAI